MFKSKTILQHIAKKEECEEHYMKNLKELDKLKELSKARTLMLNEQRDKTRSKEKISHKNAAYYKANNISLKKKSGEQYKRNKTIIAKKYHKESHSRKKFFEECQYGPIFPCVCCKRCLSLNGVKVFTEKFHQFLAEHKIDCYVDLSVLKLLNSFYICHSCYQNLSKKKMPTICFKNNLQLAEVPPCLQISSLGNQLLAKSLLFIKVRYHPVSNVGTMNDRVSFF